jgi:hypothetical protein
MAGGARWEKNLNDLGMGGGRGSIFVPFPAYALSFWRSVFPACDAGQPLL